MATKKQIFEMVTVIILGVVVGFFASVFLLAIGESHEAVQKGVYIVRGTCPGVILGEQCISQDKMGGFVFRTEVNRILSRTVNEVADFIGAPVLSEGCSAGAVYRVC